MHSTKKIKIIGFIGLILAVFMGALDATIVNIALPNIMTDLNANLTNASWVATIYVLAMASFIITASKLADIYGRKIVLLIGIIIFGGFSFACMVTNSLSLLIIYRFFQGIGGAVMTPIVLPMGIELFGKKNSSKVAAAIGAFSALAAAAGPAIGGIIINSFSYHWIFGINIPIAIISFIAILFGTKESYDYSVSKNVDLFGIILLIIFMGGLSFGLLEGRDYGWSSTTILASFTIAVISLILFIITELKVKAPTIDLHLFKEKTFTDSSIVYAIFGFAIIAPSLILNYFLQNVRQYSALHASYLIIPASISIAVGMIVATKIYYKISARLLITIGLIVTTGGLFMLSLINYETPSSIIISCNTIIGLGLGFTAMSFTASVKFLPVNKTGIGSGIVNASRYVGQAIGMALLVTTLNNNIATAKSNIKSEAYRQIKTRNLSKNVKNVFNNEIKENFKYTKNSNNISGKQTTMKYQVTRAAKETYGLPLPKLHSDYRKLYDANTKINDGIKKIANIPQLTTTVTPLVVGQHQMMTSIKLLAQKDELTSTLNKIKETKNNEISTAFGKVFLLTGTITLICIPLSAWTDKK
ncbi:MFS transporter [Leuconostoc litchii]|uniref:DHA2 family efflux MFS transporter permease subunit n=1 Tax=Leuconostoc litchii TaxID=1981069 RepID=A0A652NE24_9LACO|nr:DHA2 family efflux MFS transporter permease subunit [Leuconostoc litchii]TYC46515.1 DHA2 family efflux MFS transporter permease subunit [Leuconostoc litchii]GMA70169.1 MFS transporter [Leuconostoc litchii]